MLTANVIYDVCPFGKRHFDVMAVTMRANYVAFAHHPLYERERLAIDVLAHQEKGGSHLVACQKIEHLGRECRMRTVVEGQGSFSARPVVTIREADVSLTSNV